MMFQQHIRLFSAPKHNPKMSTKTWIVGLSLYLLLLMWRLFHPYCIAIPKRQGRDIGTGQTFGVTL